MRSTRWPKLSATPAPSCWSRICREPVSAALRTRCWPCSGGQTLRSAFASTPITCCRRLPGACRCLSLGRVQRRRTCDSGTARLYRRGARSPLYRPDGRFVRTFGSGGADRRERRRYGARRAQSQPQVGEHSGKQHFGDHGQQDGAFGNPSFREDDLCASDRRVSGKRYGA